MKIVELKESESKVSINQERTEKMILKAAQEGLTKVARRLDSCLRKIGWYQCECGKVHQAVYHRCLHKLCETCTAYRNDKIFAKYMPHIKKAKHLKFLTLTMKNISYLTRDELKQLKYDFKKLRLKYLRTHIISGGIWKLEVTFNEEENTWHPHIHALIDMRYITQQQLSQYWKEIRKDNAFIIHIREAYQEDVKYLKKYISYISDEMKLKHFLEATRGDRFIQAFGSWMRKEDELSESEEKVYISENDVQEDDQNKNYRIATSYIMINGKTKLAIYPKRQCTCGKQMSLSITTEFGYNIYMKCIIQI